MRWKLLGLMNVLFVVVALLGPRSSYGPLGLIAIAATVVAAGGVLLYAYEWTVAPRFWRFFSWLFAADSVGVIAFFVVRSAQVGSGHSPVLVASLLMTIIGCHYFTWLALRRLSDPNRPPRAAPKPARSERFGQMLAAAAKEHPKRAKVTAWVLMIAIFATVPLVVWHEFSEGNPVKLVMPAVIGLAIALRTIAKVKKIQRGE